MKITKNLFYASRVTLTKNYITDGYLLFNYNFNSLLTIGKIEEGINKHPLTDKKIEKIIVPADKKSLTNITNKIIDKDVFYNHKMPSIRIPDIKVMLQFKYYKLLYKILETNDIFQVYYKQEESPLFIYFGDKFAGAIMPMS